MTNVYFITYKDGPIKIGKAIDVRKRLSGLQTSHHQPLQVIGVVRGDDFLESRLHDRFKHLRVRGEWFERDNEIIEYILKNRDVAIYPDMAPIKPHVMVHPVHGPFGPVQVMSGEHKGKYGYYDDDECEIEACEFCDEANERGASLLEYDCPDCIAHNYAIVYFGAFVGGSYYLMDYKNLRVVDEDDERQAHDDVVYGLWPGLRQEHEKLVDDGKAEEAAEDMCWEGAPTNG